MIDIILYFNISIKFVSRFLFATSAKLWCWKVWWLCSPPPWLGQCQHITKKSSDKLRRIMIQIFSQGWVNAGIIESSMTRLGDLSLFGNNIVTPHYPHFWPIFEKGSKSFIFSWWILPRQLFGQLFSDIGRLFTQTYWSCWLQA